MMMITFIDVFIIIHSSNFDGLLSINVILYKGIKQGMLHCYMLL